MNTYNTVLEYIGVLVRSVRIELVINIVALSDFQFKCHGELSSTGHNERALSSSHYVKMDCSSSTGHNERLRAVETQLCGLEYSPRSAK
jgi:hypothetical protein